MELDAIKSALAENQELGNALLSHLADTESGKAFINRAADVHAKAKINDSYKATLTGIDETLKEFGFEAGGNAPGTLKTMDALKAALKAASERQAKIDELSQSTDDKTKSYQKKYEDLEKQSKSRVKELQEQALSLQKDFARERLAWTIEKENEVAMKAFWNEVDPTIDVDLLKRSVEMDFELLKNATELSDGQLVTKDQNGEVYRDELFNVLTPSQIIRKKYAKYLSKQPTGGGANPLPVTAENGNNSTISVPQFTAKNRVDLNAEIEDYAKSIGVAKGTEQFLEIYRTALSNFTA